MNNGSRIGLDPGIIELFAAEHNRLILEHNLPRPIVYLCAKLNRAFRFSELPLLGREKPNNFVVVTHLFPCGHAQFLTLASFPLPL